MDLGHASCATASFLRSINEKAKTCSVSDGGRYVQTDEWDYEAWDWAWEWQAGGYIQTDEWDYEAWDWTWKWESWQDEDESSWPYDGATAAWSAWSDGAAGVASAAPPAPSHSGTTRAERYQYIYDGEGNLVGQEALSTLDLEDDGTGSKAASDAASVMDTGLDEESDDPTIGDRDEDPASLFPEGP